MTTQHPRTVVAAALTAAGLLLAAGNSGRPPTRSNRYVDCLRGGREQVGVRAGDRQRGRHRHWAGDAHGRRRRDRVLNRTDLTWDNVKQTRLALEIHASNSVNMLPAKDA